jgi:hypothetical protein
MEKGRKWILIIFPVTISILFVKLLRKENGHESEHNADELSSDNGMGYFAQYLHQHKPHILHDAHLEFPKYEDEHLEEGERFFLFLPYEGATNQFISIIRAINIATTLNRTLLMPPIHSSRHDEVQNLQSDWRYFLNFTEILADPSICRIKWINRGMIPSLQKLMKEPGASCVTFGRWSELWILGLPAWHFVYGFDLGNSFRLDWRDSNACILDSVSASDSSPMICVANVFHMACGHEHAKYVKRLPFSDNVLKAAWTSLQEAGIGSSRFASIHWRRGDFEHACRNKNVTSCWPDDETLRLEIEHIHVSTGITDVVIGTNEPDFRLPESSSSDIFVSRLPSFDTGPWTPFLSIMMDSCLMTFSDYFLGNRYSSVSRIVAQRRSDMASQPSAYF